MDPGTEEIAAIIANWKDIHLVTTVIVVTQPENYHSRIRITLFENEDDIIVDNMIGENSVVRQ